MTMETRRPDWSFEEMTEAEFRKVLTVARSFATGARARTLTAGHNAADYWLEAFCLDTGKWHRLPRNWERALMFTGLARRPGLFRLTYLGECMKERVQEIDALLEAEAEDLREYERLQRKFGDAG